MNDEKRLKKEDARKLHDLERQANVKLDDFKHVGLVQRLKLAWHARHVESPAVQCHHDALYKINFDACLALYDEDSAIRVDGTLTDDERDNLFFELRHWDTNDISKRRWSPHFKDRHDAKHAEWKADGKQNLKDLLPYAISVVPWLVLGILASISRVNNNSTVVDALLAMGVFLVVAIPGLVVTGYIIDHFIARKKRRSQEAQPRGLPSSPASIDGES